MGTKNLIATLVAFISILIPTISESGTVAPRTKTARGTNFLMCDAETSTGICDHNGTKDIYIVVDQYDSITFSMTQVGTGTSCDVYAVGPEVSSVPTTDDLSSIVNPLVKINTTSLEAATPQITLTSFDFKYMWVNCSAVGSTSTTVYAHGTFGLQKW